MSYLIALIFDDQFKGEEARAALHRMAGEGLLEMNDTVFIARKPDGKTSVSQEDNVIGRDQKIGHVAGLIAVTVTHALRSGRHLSRPAYRQAHGSRNYAQVHQGLEAGITARYIRLGCAG